MNYKITALAENTTYRHNVLAQHGQSLLVEVEDYKLLFDVGEVPGSVMHNMRQLGVDLKDINDIVISHRHIDHIGALSDMISSLDEQRVLLPEQAGEPHIKEASEKYVFLEQNPDGGYDLAIEQDELNIIKEYANTSVVEENGMHLSNDIYTTGCEGDWMREQAIVIDQHELGIVLLVGCSHPTVEVLLEKAKKVTGNEKVRGIIGGFHYPDLSDTEIREKAHSFDEMGLEFLIPSHCTTVRGALILQGVLGEKVHMSKTYTLGAGNSIEIGNELKLNLV